jgi:hypothetical protein
MAELVGRPVVTSAVELLAGAAQREPFTPADGKSSVPMQRVVIDGESYVTKTISPDNDWISRATGDVGSRVLWCWRSGLLDQLPPVIDHTIVAVAHDPSTRSVTLLMRDVGRWLVPEGSAPVSNEQHEQFISHMAQLHACFWGRAELLPQLTPMSNRYLALTPLTGQIESRRGRPAEVPAMLERAWAELDAAVPDAASVARRIIADPSVLLDPLQETPVTFVHGDWKFGNLGAGPDGRTILLDWQWPGTAPPCLDLAWYLAVNCDRLPESKEDTIARYRAALAGEGVDTRGWFDRQLPLCLLGAFTQLGWGKVHDARELGWWAERAVAARAMLS